MNFKNYNLIIRELILKIIVGAGSAALLALILMNA